MRYGLLSLVVAGGQNTQLLRLRPKGNAGGKSTHITEVIALDRRIYKALGDLQLPRYLGSRAAPGTLAAG